MFEQIAEITKPPKYCRWCKTLLMDRAYKDEFCDRHCHTMYYDEIHDDVDHDEAGHYASEDY